jgi:acetylornithine deacetylase/succinyl-diaminopimelate desuccinylase-like protein
MTMHQKNECVSIEQLKQTQQIYEEMIEMLCK